MGGGCVRVSAILRMPADMTAMVRCLDDVFHVLPDPAGAGTATRQMNATRLWHCLHAAMTAKR
jgi:hypothetical protein